MDQHSQWFENFRNSKDYQSFKERPVAYFCAEFALTDDSPTYAGGLGVLAGDMIREAADQRLPLVAVGLYYHEGYAHHEISSEGTQLKHPIRKQPEGFGLRRVMTPDNQPLIVTIPLEGRQLSVTAWEKQIGSTVRVYLLDTDIAENDAEDRNITNMLYVANKETRFKQEMVLGIAGLRILEAMKIHPLLYHLNEGHSALLSLEIAYHEMNEYSKSFMEELQQAKLHIIFTNHTLVAAGNDMFNSDMVTALLNDYSQQVRVPVQDLVSFGLVHESNIFSMTVLALRMANKINAVSKLHAEKAKDIWHDHPMVAVTNGVHIPTWDKLRKFEARNPKSETISAKKQNINDKNVSDFAHSNLEFVSNFDIRISDLWNSHQNNKRELLKFITEKIGQVWNESDLLIGWARRMVGYKRPLALFQEKERLKNLLLDSKRPLRVVMAGSAHESDKEGAAMLEDLEKMITTEFNGYVVCLPNYNVQVARVMVSGCDIWLNTPVVGFEACGTSGMKAALNGCLPVSTKDGWVEEIEMYGVGWILDNDTVTQSLLDTLEHQIIPMYYYRDKQGFPGAWVENMQHSREMIMHQYSATRMLREYIEQMYLPTIAGLQKG